MASVCHHGRWKPHHAGFVENAGLKVVAPYGLEVIERCCTCRLRVEANMFCNLSTTALQSLETVKNTIAYPTGVVLFLEGQTPSGVFILCRGRVKMSVSARDGKTVILELNRTGDVLGLAGTLSGKPYEATAETLEPCQFSFIRRDDFLNLMRTHSDLSLRAAEHLSGKYTALCQEIRSLALMHSVAGRLAKLLIELAEKNCESGQPSCLKLALTHDEIGQMVGASRETVSRTFAGFRRNHLIKQRGSTILLCDKASLRALAGG